MSETAERSCCCRCVSFIITSGLTALFLWLSLKTTKPICSIEEFDAFALNKTSKSTLHNHTIHYDLKLNNKNKDKGVYYDALNLTFFYNPNLSFPIGNATFSGFHQGHQKSTHRIGNINPIGVNWENATTANGTAVFRVELWTAVRYKIIFWKTKRHRLVLGANLQVNNQGRLVKRKKNKGIKLSSGALRRSKGYFELLAILGLLFFLLNFGRWGFY